MFKRLPEAQQAMRQHPVAVTINGQPVQCRDGQPNQQGCMTLVREGMNIARQSGARQVRT